MKMKIIPILVAFILALFLLPASGQEGKDGKGVFKVKKKEKFHIYILIGGSNLIVKNTFTNPDRKADGRIFLFDDDNEWVPAEDHMKSSGSKPEEKGTGPSIFFAETMLSWEKDKDVAIGLVNCAEEDSELADWLKDGKYYVKALEKAGLAMKSGVVKGILWHQANAEMKKADPLKYAENIGKIAADLRKDLNSPNFHPIPFVGGKLVSHPYFKEEDDFKALNATLQKTFNDTERSGLVESKGLKDSGDGIHFDAESMSEFGKRYAETMIYFEGKKK